METITHTKTLAEWQALLSRRVANIDTHRANCVLCDLFKRSGTCRIGKAIAKASDQAHEGYKVWLQSQQGG